MHEAQDQHEAAAAPLPSAWPSRLRDPFAPEPWARRAALLAPGLTRDPAQLASFGAAHLEGDALADALVGWLSAGPSKERRAAFEAALSQGIRALPRPAPELAAFFADVERVPPWLDRATIGVASDLYHRAFPAAERVLFSASLLAGYVSSGIAKTLVGTAALERMAVRRVAETQQFVTDLYGPGALARTSPGFRTTVRVRVLHAMVRSQLLARGFEVARWGLPINQADMAATALQFSITYVLGLRALGVHVSAAEADAVLHLWRYAGRLMGVRDELLPRTEDEARRQLRLTLASQAGPDDDSRALAKALVTMPRTLALPPALRHLADMDFAFRAGFARLVLGEEAADGLGLPKSAARYAPIALFPLVYTTECVRRITPFGTRIAVRAGRRLAEWSTARRLAGRRAEFAPYS